MLADTIECIRIVHEHADRELWLTERKRFSMTASEASTVLQEPHGKYPPRPREELAQIKRGELVPEELGEAAHWGTVMEPHIIERAQALWPDSLYEPFGWLCQDPVEPLMGATPDALRLDDDGKTIIPVQCKCTAYFPFGQGTKPKPVPIPWQLQVQVEMAVLNAPACELLILHLTKRELRRYLVERDDELIATLRSAALTFQNDFIDGGRK